MRILPLMLFCLLPCVPAMAASHAGDTLPDFVIHTLDGHDLHRHDFDGKVLVVHFWATWCGACLTEMPALQRFYREHRPEGLEVVAISADGPADRAKVVEMARAYNFASALLDDCQIDALGRIWVLPLTFVVDRHGVLRIADWTGNEHIDAALLNQRLLPLLGER